MTLVQCRGLCVERGSKRVLDVVDLTIAPGEAVGIQGPSGSGKSTLLHVLAGLLPPVSGEVVLDGFAVWTASDRGRSHFRLRRMGIVFQTGDLIPELNVVENVELPLRLMKVSRRQARQKAEEMLGSLGIGDLEGRALRQISGGQLQRVAIGRALIHDPAIVLADEPTGALDDENARVAVELLIARARDAGAAVVVVTHSRDVAAVVDRRLAMVDGALRPERETPLFGDLL